MTFAKLVLSAALVFVVLMPTAADAALPGPVRAMIEAAIATGDKTKVKTVVDIAKQTNPDDAAEIDSLDDAFNNRLSRKSAADKAKEQAAIRSAGLFEDWHGKGEFGVSQSSGNSHDLGVSLALNLDRKGIDWEHKLSASIDYQRSNGQTSRERYQFTYEPRYNIEPDLFAFGLGQFESDRILGYSRRYSLSGGLGYKLVNTPDVKLAVKAGPALRHTALIDGGSETNLGALAGLDFDWQISRWLKFNQGANMVAETGANATALVTSHDTTLALNSGLEAKVSNRFSTKLSYSLNYDSSPPPQAVSTDTLTRFTMVYGF